ncbi:MAG: T9SS type A sorting domain-containing protein [Chitinophagales bacterium]|nr:T9SS type A sorting domain-containing protein [Chitinophagales bacterium]
MKSITLTLFLAFALNSFSQNTAHFCSGVKQMVNATAQNKLLSASQQIQASKYNIHYYFLNLNMTNNSTALSGTVEIHATASVNLDTAILELYQSLNVSSVLVDGASTSFVHSGNILYIPVNKLQSENFILSIDYAGTPPTSQNNPFGGGGMSNASSPSWGNTVTWSLSEPFMAYEWFPCKQDLKDKADSCAVWITVPLSCKAGSNGLLQQVVDLGNGKHRFEWKHKHPIAYYLISVAVAKYVEYNVYAHPVFSDSVLIQNYIYDNPQTLPYVKKDVDETADFLELFANLFGPYPFGNEKYGHCMAPISGGMEHQTMTTQGFFMNTLTAHELAHQWFGDHVTCSSWSNIWVSEGFASYAEDLMLEYLYPADRAPNMLNRHNNVMDSLGGSVWVKDSLNDESIFDSRLVYDKGAAIVHTLRFLMNDDAKFLSALKQIQFQYADSNASAMDLIQVFENVSGKSFTDFAEQWYYGEGYPTYGVRWNKDNANFYIEVNATVSKPSVTSVFTNDLELLFSRSTGTDTVMRFSIDGAQTQIAFPNTNNFTGVKKIDPRNWIINKEKPIVKDSTFTVTTAIKTPTLNDFEVYPNPTSGIVNLKMNTSGDYHFALLDMKGKVVQQGSFASDTNFDISQFTQGMYLLQVTNSLSGNRSIKLIKH